MKKKNQPKFALARVKKIIQTNEDIGKISHSIPFLLSKSLEMFLSQLITKSIDLCKQTEKQKLTPSTLKKIIETEQKFHFLKDTVKDVISLEEEKPNKRVRSKKEKKKQEELDDPSEKVPEIEKSTKKIKKERKPRKKKQKELSMDDSFDSLKV